ncbi:hypothetical protein L2703_02500 [Shewanella basaltis]|uniref:hypothetical protein n=1 Tax=Shewanella basaltis TaxID=472183 RepID=UPI00200F25F8|nr:hypothetical protein [Shewanella basaltis]MCL1112480.1 hypothetical protein [Shewanella basaltis]
MAKSIWKDDATAKELISRVSQCQSNQSSIMKISQQNYKSSFDSFEFSHYMSLLRENIKFGDFPNNVRDQALTIAIFKSADEGKLNSGFVSGILKQEEAKYLAKPFKDFCLVTGISVNCLKSRLKIRTELAEISISKGFPKTFKSDYDFGHAEKTYPNINSGSFSWVVVKVSARCFHSGANLALEELNYFLGVINHYLVSGGRRQSFGMTDPISKVRKYPLHYLFNPDGSLATELRWYEPYFSQEGPTYHYDQSFKDACKHFRKLHKTILKSNRYRFFKTVFGRLTDALETNDMQKAFLSLWSLLEKLTFTQKDNYTTTINRTLVLFKDKFIVNQDLELLRQKRNIAIHSGEQFEQSEEYAYMLYSYIRHYIFFILKIMLKVRLDDDIKSLLDLPITSSKIQEYEDALDKQLKQVYLLKELIKFS